MVTLDDKEYVKSLEDLLIFICDFHEDSKKEFMYNPKTCDKFPVIQGMHRQIAIKKISELPFNSTKDCIKNTYHEMVRRRGLE